MSESTKKTETKQPAVKAKAKQLHYVPDYGVTVEATDSIEAGEIAKKQFEAARKSTNKRKEEQ